MKNKDDINWENTNAYCQPTRSHDTTRICVRISPFDKNRI